MSSSVQPISNILPITKVEKGETTAKSGNQKEYEEGKRFLESGDFGQAALTLHNALVGFEEKGDNGVWAITAIDE